MTEPIKNRVAFFDADGTIFDNAELQKRIFVSVLRSHPINPGQAEEFYEETAGLHLAAQYREILKKNKIKPDEKILAALLKDFNDKANGFFGEKVACFPEVREVLRELRLRRVVLVLTSGSQTRVLIRRLRENAMEDFFSLVIGSDAIPKENCLHIRRAASVLGLGENFERSAFYVGDGCYDMEQAKTAGMMAIGVDRKNGVSARKLFLAGADAVISTLTELVYF